MSEVEERITRIKQHKGVKGLLIVGEDGNIIRNTLGSGNDKESKSYAHHVSEIAKKAKSVIRDINPLDDLTFFRIKAKRQEILVAPDKSYFLIVIQNIDEENDAINRS
ncbi:unnamed protein product [Moneuplotes crassus]|uniref:Dynein light chain roadblock n=1 Tax=Euplotes crassus TaxID=5936 RepID=A0AAD1Y7I7_EUPCR|nr:unnamed protein product [Moneuplotes crassus]|mmetsp:Transcript_19610/g.19267  ORF Transcript_19610/g.19267 Transcript_19610/m.19267 type:complete len:108 (-) Transcript_19610:6-329(-)|eukprot:CAMPEP_0197015510 /NCGR_PEP_ID=MMETSP1380-20130617/74503_1 /TAXON_ID=5936 /ORGANISM="Euplotes crassus, Strain CT5" /LENGTH=107 /DNA_ID=CAMNT_0042441481 /DNA_START=7 /DNA_END=326 /DNA_ORIENTATION=+